MSRRDRIDPETARLVEERLQWLLRQNGPQPPDRVERLRSGPDPATGPARPVGRRAVRPAGDPPTGGPPAATARPDRRRRPPREPDPEVEAKTPVIEAGSAATDHAARVDHAARADRTTRRPRPPTVEETPAAGPVAALRLAATTFRRPHLAIVAGLVALGILLAGWAVLRARPVAIAVTPPVAAASPTAGATAGSPAGTSGSGGADTATPRPTAPSLVVHVLGAVRQPGLVTLTAGSRVQDALDAAGGLTRKADPGELNLAQQVSDGEQIMVGTKGRPSGELRGGAAGGSGGSGSGSSGGSRAGGQPVDLNSASQAELEELPGVGPVMAGKIIAWRTEHGRFSRVEELQEIDGVGPKTYAKLAPLCRV